MRKVFGIIVSMFLVVTASINCFAQNDQVSKQPTDNLIKKITQQMIKEKQLSKDCITKSKGDGRKMITVNIINIGKEDSPVEGYQIESAQNEFCVMGNSRAPAWVYKKNNRGDGITRVFGPEYPDQIVFYPDIFKNGLRYMVVIYPDGNSEPGINEYYAFSGKEYKIVETEKRRKMRN